MAHLVLTFNLLFPSRCDYLFWVNQIDLSLGGRNCCTQLPPNLMLPWSIYPSQWMSIYESRLDPAAVQFTLDPPTGMLSPQLRTGPSGRSGLIWIIVGT